MIWYVAVGSAAGGAARYAISAYLQRATGSSFPVGTLVVNITGSFLLGLLLRFALATPEMSPELRLGLSAGFCGGYTTFSTFSVETIAMVEAGQWERALLYVGLSVAASLIGAFAGLVLARELLVLRHSA